MLSVIAVSLSVWSCVCHRARGSEGKVRAPRSASAGQALRRTVRPVGHRLVERWEGEAGGELPHGLVHPARRTHIRLVVEAGQGSGVLPTVLVGRDAALAPGTGVAVVAGCRAGCPAGAC